MDILKTQSGEFSIRNLEKRHSQQSIETSLCMYHIIQEQRGYTKSYKSSLGTTVSLKKTQTLGDILLKKGRHIPKEYRKNIVYSIPCADCNKKYVGQTTKPLKNRNKEHENWCKPKFKKKLLKSSKKNDGIAYHHH